MRRPSLVFGLVASAAMCCGLLTGTVPAGAVAATRDWGPAQQVPGLAALSTSGASTVGSVSCASAGNCAVAGGYTDSSNRDWEFVADETNRSWGAEQQVPGLAALDVGGYARIFSVSCASAGDCAIGGYYTDSSGKIQAFVADEVGGSWGAAQEVPGLATLNAGGQAAVVSVSCASAGNCAAVGSYEDSSYHYQGFVVDEVGGSWGSAQETPGEGALNAGGNSSLDSVSCPSPGDCAAVGSYADSAGLPHGLVADETGGSWGTAQEVPGMAALESGGRSYLGTVSCASPGDCAAGGSYLGASGGPQGFVVDEAGGSWGAAQQVPGLTALNVGQHAAVYSVSCASAGNCAAGGYYRDSSHNAQAFVADEVGGSWGAAQQLPGSGPLNAGGDARVLSVSCASAGDCAAGGYYTDSSTHQQAFVADEAGGSWGAAEQVPGTDALNTGGDARVASVSCPVAGDCAAGGYYTGSFVYSDAFVVGEGWATSTVISLSAPTVAYGGEQSEQVSVGVSSAGGTPDGSVTVKSGQVVLCTVTLASGSGSCALPPAGLPAGTAQLTASYSGSADFAASVSPATTLTVSQASSATSLSLSAPVATYGNEQAEQVTVGVSSTGGTPDGTVIVNAGPTRLCTITLASGGGSCALPAAGLPAGTAQLTASYNGSADFAASASTTKDLTVSQASSATSLSLSAAAATYGNEQAEQVTVGVSSTGGTPDGTVTVNAGPTRLCTITLASGSGSCALPATGVPAGTAQLTASYSGSADFAASVSPATTLTVSQAASRVKLRLSRKRVVYGKERRERLTVTVTARYGGTPGGKVVIKTRKGHGRAKTICTIRLAAGQGKCVLAARQLRAGTYRLTARYLGAADFTASTATASLNVRK